MIPQRRRPNSTTPSTPTTESIPDTLARLRAEQRRAFYNTTTSSRRSRCSGTSTNNSSSRSSLPAGLRSFTTLDIGTDASHLGTIDAVRTRGTRLTTSAGPPAPRSWLLEEEEEGEEEEDDDDDDDDENFSGSNRRKTLPIPSTVNRRLRTTSNSANIIAYNEYRRKILEPLGGYHDIATGSSNFRIITPLYITCAHLIAASIVPSSSKNIPPGLSKRRKKRREMILPFLQFLPDHLRLNLFDWVVALPASTKTTTRHDYFLDQRSISELLRTYDDDDDDVVDGYYPEELECVSTMSPNSAEVKMKEKDIGTDDEWDDEIDNSDDKESDLFSNHLHQQRFPYQVLTSLNLAFSSIKLRFLQDLLLSTNGTRSIPVFPHLHTLDLSATNRLHFIDESEHIDQTSMNTMTLFNVLSHLISLRSLSLAGKSINSTHPRNPSQQIDISVLQTLSPSNFLTRLISSTPTLISINLNYLTNPLLEVNLLKNSNLIKWDTQWLDLVRLGLKFELVVHSIKSGVLLEIERRKDAQDLLKVVLEKGKRSRKKMWLEVYI